MVVLYRVYKPLTIFKERSIYSSAWQMNISNHAAPYEDILDRGLKVAVVSICIATPPCTPNRIRLDFTTNQMRVFQLLYHMYIVEFDV